MELLDMTRPGAAMNVALWIHDLETTTDPQTQGYLTVVRAEPGGDVPVGDCCLGRLYKTLGYEGTLDPYCHQSRAFHMVYVDDDNVSSMLGRSAYLNIGGYENENDVYVRVPSDLASPSMEPDGFYDVTELNDGKGFSFTQIAACLRYTYPDASRLADEAARAASNA